MADLFCTFRLAGNRRLALAALSLLLFRNEVAHGQRAEASARQLIRLKAYGAFSYVRPDNNDSRAPGATLGGDIDGFHLLPHVELGLDARYSYSKGYFANQSFFGGGPRVSLELGAFQPYGDYLLGRGKEHFNHPLDPNYREDDTTVMAFGGGLDYRLSRSWSIRADVQRQRWSFSVRQPYFHPVAVSVGASYQLHFRSRTGPGF